METAMKVRGWILRDGRGIRAVARETGLSRPTIKKYLKDDAPPQYRRSRERAGLKLSAVFESFSNTICSFAAVSVAPRRSFMRRLSRKATRGPYSPVQRFVRELKQTTGTGTGDAFIPLHFAAGDALQFDWSEEYVMLGGVEHKVHVAHFRLCHNRKPFVVAYLNEKQEMVLDAFIRALAFFGGVPRRGEHRSTKGGKTSGRRFEM
jgi:transposase